MLPVQKILNTRYCLALCLAASPFAWHTATGGEADFALKESMEFTIKAKDDTAYTAVAKVSREVTYLTERATKQTVYQVYESPFAPVTKVKGRIDSHGLSANEIYSAPAERKDVFIPGDRIHLLRISDAINVGAKFEYSYEEKYTGVGFFPLLEIPNADSLVEFRCLFKHPDDVTIVPEFFFPRDSIPCRYERSGDDETVLTFGPCAHASALPFFPFNEIHAAVYVTLRKGGKRMSPTSIDRFAAWYGAMTPFVPALDSTGRACLADSLKTPGDASGKLRIIHDYVRSTIRYAADERGLNAIVPRPPSMVLRQGYGDCKDRAALATALAREHGIGVSMALVSADQWPKRAGVHFEMFNHVICAYHDGAATKFFDPTSRYHEFGNLPERECGLQALVLEPGAVRFETITLPVRAPSVEVAIDVRTDSLESGTATIVLRNDDRVKYLYKTQEVAQDKVKGVLQDILGSRLYQVRFDRFVVGADDGASVSISARADVSRLVIASTGRWYVARGPFATFDNDILERLIDPWAVYTTGMASARLSLTLHGAALLAQPDSVTLGSPARGIWFAARSENRAGAPHFEYDIRQSQTAFAGDAKDELLAFYRRYSQNRKNMFIVSGK